MGDKSESSCLESEDECEVENQRMDLGLLRDTPSLATDVEGCLSLAEENSAASEFSDGPIKAFPLGTPGGPGGMGWEVPRNAGKFFTNGGPGGMGLFYKQIQTGKTLERSESESSIKRGHDESEEMFEIRGKYENSKRRRSLSKAGDSGSKMSNMKGNCGSQGEIKRGCRPLNSMIKKSSRRAILISSSSSEADEEEQPKRDGKVASKLLIISSSEEEDSNPGVIIRDNENNLIKSYSCIRPGQISTKEGVGNVLRESGLLRGNSISSPSSEASLEKLPGQSTVIGSVALPKMESWVQEEEDDRTRKKNSQERKDDWLEKVLIQILAERARGCEEEGEKSLLLAAKHLVQCKNCDNTRLHGKNCWECKLETRENVASSKKVEKEKGETIRMDDRTALDRNTEEDLQFSWISRKVGEGTSRSWSSNHEREVRKRFLEKGKRSRSKQMTSLLMEAESSQNERRGQERKAGSNLHLSKKTCQGPRSFSGRELFGDDKIRSKSVLMLQAAIGGFYLPDLVQEANSNHGNKFVENMALDVEKQIFALYRRNMLSYPRKVRNIILNLKGNPELRNNLLTGVIAPKDLASMSTEEMASSKLNTVRREEANLALEERLVSDPIYSNLPTWQYLTDRQLDREGESRL